MATNQNSDDGKNAGLCATVQIPRPNLNAPRYKGLIVFERDQPLLEGLTPIYREVLRLRGSYEEMAAALRVPVGTLRSRLHRARSALVKLRVDNPPGVRQNGQGEIDKPAAQIRPPVR